METALKRLFFTIFVFVQSVCIPAMSAERSLVLAVHPYLPESEIHNRFEPLVNYLSKEMNRPVQIRVGGDYAEHIAAIGKNKVDIAFLGPAAYVNVVKQYGSKPVLARFELAGNPYLFGVIAVRKESTVSSLGELADKSFAFGDPGSTMSHIVPRFMMMQAGIKDGLPVEHHYLGSHKNVALGILVGDFQAGAMKKEIFDEFESRGLKALAITPGVPDHLFITRSDLPQRDINRIRRALLRLEQSDRNSVLILKKMHKRLTALVSAKNSDYGELAKMVWAVEEVAR